MAQRILVWDIPIRIFHWMLVLSFSGAFLTGDSERWRDIHVLFGYTVLGLIAFRLIWGFIGSRYVRFAEFVPRLVYIVRYCSQLIRGRAWHPIGHNPAGTIAILLLLSLGIISGISGWAIYEEIGGNWLEELHEFSSNTMLAVVLVHIVGVLTVSYLQRENLISAMFTGRKHGASNQAISSSYPLIALLLLTVLIGCWILAWPDSRDEKWVREIASGLSFISHPSYH